MSYNKTQGVSMSSQQWVLASSGLFFLPAAISVFTQSVVVTLIYAGSALFSLLYHCTQEEQYGDVDLQMAIMAILISLVLLSVVANKYSWTSWRVLLPVVFGVIGMAIYFLEGQSCSIVHDKENYRLYHSLWHLLMAISGTLLVITPVDLGDARRVLSSSLHR
jgi:hypothetical protein